MPRRPRTVASRSMRTVAGALNGLENSSPPPRLNRATKLAPSPSACASAASAGSWITPTSASVTPAVRNACRIHIVLPRPPPPGLSATSANISAGLARSGRTNREPHRVIQDGQGRAEPLPPSPPGLRDLARQACRRIRVGRGDHDRQPIERRVGIGEAAHDRNIQHPPGIRRLVHPLLAEIDQLAIRPLRARPCRSAASPSAARSAGGCAPGRSACPPISRRSSCAASAPRSRMSRCGLVR